MQLHLEDFNALDTFTARQSSDPVKRDLELMCERCGEVLCDIEPGDGLGTLVSMAVEHACRKADV